MASSVRVTTKTVQSSTKSPRAQTTRRIRVASEQKSELELPTRRTESLRSQNVMSAIDIIDKSAHSVLEAIKSLRLYVQELEADLEATRQAAEEQFAELLSTSQQEIAGLESELDGERTRYADLRLSMEKELATAERQRERDLANANREHEKNVERLERGFDKERQGFRDQMESEKRRFDAQLGEARAEGEGALVQQRSEYESKLEKMEASLVASREDTNKWRERCEKLESRMATARDYIEAPIRSRA